MQETVGEFFDPFKTQEGAADHQEGDNRPGRYGADEERGGHQDQLVEGGSFGDRPHHRKLAFGGDSGDLLGVQGEVVAEHAGGFFGGDFGHHRHVVEDRRDVVDQGKKAAAGHGIRFQSRLALSVPAAVTWIRRR